MVMNRDRLVSAAIDAVAALAPDYHPRHPPEFVLTGGDVYSQMVEFLEKGRQKGLFFAHDVTVASAVASIVTGGADCAHRGASEQELFDLERANFIKLAKTPETKIRIETMLGGGGLIRN